MLRVMSFNIRGFSHRGDRTKRWQNRAGSNVATIKRHAPDLIGLQEVGPESLATYRAELPEYERILGPAAGSKAPHEYNAILFDPARLEVLERGGFWLSETPDRYSFAWRTRVVRAANWARFRSAHSGVSFLHLNTHLDHVSSLARAKGSELIVRRLSELQEDGLSAVVTGDFNCRPGSVPYLRFVASGFEDTFLAAGNEGDERGRTFPAFAGTRYSLMRWTDLARGGGRPCRIDWILVRNGRPRLRTEAQEIVRDLHAQSAVQPSDHYPVLATFVLGAEHKTDPPDP